MVSQRARVDLAVTCSIVARPCARSRSSISISPFDAGNGTDAVVVDEGLGHMLPLLVPINERVRGSRRAVLSFVRSVRRLRNPHALVR